MPEILGVTDANEGGPSLDPPSPYFVFAGEPNDLAARQITRIRDTAVGWNNVRRFEFGGA
jgi:hypothetical protein